MLTGVLLFDVLRHTRWWWRVCDCACSIGHTSCGCWTRSRASDVASDIKVMQSKLETSEDLERQSASQWAQLSAQFSGLQSALSVHVDEAEQTRLRERCVHAPPPLTKRSGHVSPMVTVACDDGVVSARGIDVTCVVRGVVSVPSSQEIEALQAQLSKSRRASSPSNGPRHKGKGASKHRTHRHRSPSPRRHQRSPTHSRRHPSTGRSSKESVDRRREHRNRHHHSHHPHKHHHHHHHRHHGRSSGDGTPSRRSQGPARKNNNTPRGSTALPVSPPTRFPPRLDPQAVATAEEEVAAFTAQEVAAWDARVADAKRTAEARETEVAQRIQEELHAWLEGLGTQYASEMQALLRRRVGAHTSEKERAEALRRDVAYLRYRAGEEVDPSVLPEEEVRQPRVWAANCCRWHTCSGWSETMRACAALGTRRKCGVSSRGVARCSPPLLFCFCHPLGVMWCTTGSCHARVQRRAHAAPNRVETPSRSCNHVGEGEPVFHYT